MIYIVCQQCPAVLRVCPGEDGALEGLVGPGSDWYPSSYPCPKCSGKGVFTTTLEPEKLMMSYVIDLNPQEAFVALSGAGLPDEHDCGSTAVQQLFGSRRVTLVVTRPVHGSNRCVIEFVEFEDGTRAYFGSSSFGAIVYRIAKPYSYAKAADAE